MMAMRDEQIGSRRGCLVMILIVAILVLLLVAVVLWVRRQPGTALPGVVAQTRVALSVQRSA